jgi:lambda repressor-like predicted transcriptional regulator
LPDNFTNLTKPLRTKGTTIVDIATESGYSEAAIYSHIQQKHTNAKNAGVIAAKLGYAPEDKVHPQCH